MTGNATGKRVQDALGRVTSHRAQSARGAMWEAQLGLRRVSAEMKRTIQHKTGDMANCPLCMALLAIQDAERELNECRKEMAA